MRLPLAFAALLLTLPGLACRGKHETAAVQNEEQPEPGPRIASAFRMNDPAAPAQLLHGFYGIESGTWRWTAGKFSVLLRPPLASAQYGATLTFAFSVPDVVIQKVGAFTLTATSGGTTLKAEKYTKPGNYTFAADVPPEMLLKETITIDFALDKNLSSGTVDHRDLGIIAISTGLESK